tara:strand:+ start:374 stop:619 length:246 start_codon:yes stop_codon:yes gene_type:complete
MPDPNHIPGYDAWKTSGPEETNRTMPKFTGDVWLTVCVTYNKHECEDEETLEQETRDLIRSRVDGLGGVYVTLEDSDLLQH